MPKSIKDRVEESLGKIHCVRIDKIEDLFQLLTDQPYDRKIDRHRSPYFYRGLSDSSYFLQTSLQRNCGEEGSTLEPPILRNFAKYAIDRDTQITESVWRQMVLGQHHGLPTRLLDWTYSPLVALHFAVTSDNPKDISKTDCVVWKIHCEDLSDTLPTKYKEQLIKHRAYLFTMDMLEACAGSLDEYDIAMKAANSIAMLEPPSIDQRIINQYSYFTVTPNHIDCLEEFMAASMPRTVRYIIKGDLRWRIRDMLDQMNINERTLLPGFDGLAAWLKRYYYVKNSPHT